jgi:hypothetical protein
MVILSGWESDFGRKSFVLGDCMIWLCTVMSGKAGFRPVLLPIPTAAIYSTNARCGTNHRPRTVVYCRVSRAKNFAYNSRTGPQPRNSAAIYVSLRVAFLTRGMPKNVAGGRGFARNAQATGAGGSSPSSASRRSPGSRSTVSLKPSSSSPAARSVSLSVWGGCGGRRVPVRVDHELGIAAAGEAVGPVRRILRPLTLRAPS